MDKCVYLHKHNGVPFYVGKGSLARAFKLEKSIRKGQGTYRGKDYSDFVSSVDFNIEVEIVGDNLSEIDASELELAMFKKLTESGVKLLNKRPPVREKEIPLDLVIKYLKYDESSESGLVWIDGKFKGKMAGSKSLTTWRVKLKQEEYYCSRIICALFGCVLEGKVVDHINGDRFDNNISNLRVVSQQENMLNNKLHSHNTTGFVGVSYNSGLNCYRAYYSIDGKYKYKDFYVSKLGSDRALELAVEFRKQGINIAKEYGFNYTERHGKRHD